MCRLFGKVISEYDISFEIRNGCSTKEVGSIPTTIQLVTLGLSIGPLKPKYVSSILTVITKIKNLILIINKTQ